MERMDHEELDLLQRHAPLLHLDPLERWAPAPVDGFLAASAVMRGAEHLDGPPAALGATPSPCPAGLHVDPVRVRPHERAAAMLRVCGPAPAPGGWRCYGETAPLDDAGRRALRYWCFYPDNPFGVRFEDVGRHVGDWELVQVELDPAGAVEAVTVFQHGSPQRVAAGDRKLTLEDGRPHVYVAEGSHAAYLTAGSQPRLLKRDNTSADGQVGVPGVLPMPGDDDGWTAWCGRWGPDTGPLLAGWMLRLGRWIAHRGLGGESPPGPRGRDRPRRSADARRARAAGRRSIVARLVVPALRRIGTATWPRDVAIDRAAGVRFADGVVTLRVRAGGGGLRRASYVDAVVADAQGVALGVRRARVPGRGVVELDVGVLTEAGPGSGLGVAPGPPAEVRVAGYNRLDQRSDVDRAPVG